MPPRDRREEPDQSAAEPARNPEKSSDELAKTGADDRGGSRDGERLDPGDAGDRGQLDNDDGRKPMK